MLVKLSDINILDKLPSFTTVNPHTYIDWLSIITDRVINWDELLKDSYKSVPIYLPRSAEGYKGKIFTILEWSKNMAKNNSCLVAAKNSVGTYTTSDVGYGILALLRYPFQLFVTSDESDIDKVRRTGNEYALIVLADNRPCYYIRKPAVDIATVLSMIDAPILVPKSALTYKNLPAYITVTEVKEVVTIACEFPGSRNGATPALSGEYSHFYSFEKNDKTYIAPEVKATEVVMLTTPYTGGVNLVVLATMPSFEVKNKKSIGGYASTGFVGVSK